VAFDLRGRVLRTFTKAFRPAKVSAADLTALEEETLSALPASMQTAQARTRSRAQPSMEPFQHTTASCFETPKEICGFRILRSPARHESLGQYSRRMVAFGEPYTSRRAFACLKSGATTSSGAGQMPTGRCTFSSLTC
jgi:hypothetical protein